jgi:NAD+ synthase (glutamine-hydrolysing)
MVVGTGDLSELALGWCTYGVGDQMSHYNVNASVPKTLIRHLIGWVAAHPECRAATAEVLRAVLDTPISPELVPGSDSQSQPAQMTEDEIGPYELHDFSLYYLTRRGYSPAKVAYLACEAFARGPQAAYTEAQVFDWLEVFLKRFFGSSQFKRSAMPNGPKVGSGGSLSPRGDWRAPSDAGARTWLDALTEARAWAQPAGGEPLPKS